MGRRRLSPKRALAIAAGALLILALLPTRYTRWAGWFRNPALVALAPAAKPMSMLGRWALPERSRAALPEEILALTQELEKFKTLWRQEGAARADAERRLSEIQRGRALNPRMDVAPIVAPIIGAATDPSSGAIQARAGSDRGVALHDVAVVGGVHLVGQVVDVSGLTCSILPITHRSTGYIDGVVDVPGADATHLPVCQLAPGRDGDLSGDLERDAPGVALGLYVRLRDVRWPAPAQMLIVGRITAMGPKESQPLRTVITVRPEVDFRRLGDVLIYTAAPAANSGAEAPR